MEKDIFENAQFGDVYLCHNGDKAIWIDENKLAMYNGGYGVAIVDESYIKEKIVRKEPDEVLKDPFDYEKITEEDTNDIENFEKHYETHCKYGYKLSRVEYARFLKFCENHRHEGVNRGAIGGGTVVSFMGTGLGNVVHCKCSICGETADITDFDCW